MNNYSKAIEFAITAHHGTFRKGTTIPYFSHLLQVSGLVLEFGGTTDEAIGALLHDAAEDAGGEEMLAKIRLAFGPQVEQMVRENSDSLTSHKEEKPDWKKRKVAYVDAIAHKSESALLVSVCDKIHNGRSLCTDTRNLGMDHWNRFNATAADSLWYYRSLLKSFNDRAAEFPRIKNAIREYEVVVRELVALAA